LTLHKCGSGGFNRGDIAAELVDGLAPAAFMTIALVPRLERRLPEGHAVLAVLFCKGNGHQVLLATLAVFFPSEGEDEARCLDDLAIDAAEPIILALTGADQGA